MRKSRVLLINPPKTEQVFFNNPPLALLYLAGTLRKNSINVKVIDGFFEGWKGVVRVIKSYRPTLVGVPCLTPFRHQSFRVAQIAKRLDPKIVTVLGGAHATIMHTQILENYPDVDLVVRGEGEQVLLNIARGTPWPKIKGLSYRDQGIVKVNQPQRYETDLDRIPFPDWSQLDLGRYPALSGGVLEFNGVNLEKEPRVSVVFSRGCTGNCTFCSTWWIWRGWRGRSGKNMFDELELLYQKFGIRHFCFADDCMTTDRQAVTGLCDLIVKRNLKIAFNITTRADAVTLPMLRKLKEAGCYSVAYGIESASEKILRMMNKKITLRKSTSAIALTKKAGIKATALMITGNVGETWQTINDSIRFLQKTKPDFTGTIGGLWVLPGTKIYADLKHRGIIGDDYWLTQNELYTYRGNFTPRQLRYIRLSLEKRAPVRYRQKPWNSPAFRVFYYAELLAKKNRYIKHSLIRFYDPFDRLVKLIG